MSSQNKPREDRTEVVAITLKIGVPVIAGKSAESSKLADDIYNEEYIPDGAVVLSKTFHGNTRVHLEPVTDAAE